MSKGLLTAILLSVALAVSLSLLPERALDRWGGDAFSQDRQEARDVPVTKMEGVVDQLGALTLSSRLQKVVWEREKLVVWLAVPKAKLTRDRPYQDIYRISHRFLVGVPQNGDDNQQVEVRVVSLEQPQHVEFAVLADRKSMVDAPRPDSPQAAAFVQQKLRVVEMK